jgi:phage tail sheath protein FI
MPEYLTPGVYLEETSFRSKSIEGVATSTFGMAGVATYGPVPYVLTNPNVVMVPSPTLVTSFTEYERAFGGLEEVQGQTNYLAHAARAFFANGGRRLYVARAFGFALDGAGAVDASNFGALPVTGGLATWRARWPGSAGNTISLRFGFRRSKNILVGGEARGISPGAAVETIADRTAVPSDTTAPVANNVQVVAVDPATNKLAFVDVAGAFTPIVDDGVSGLCHLTLTVDVRMGTRVDSYPGLELDSRHARSVAQVLQAERPSDELGLVWLDENGPAGTTVGDLLVAMLAMTPLPTDWVFLSGATDGAGITEADILGRESDPDDASEAARGLGALGEVEDIAIVATPDAARFADPKTAVDNLIGHCERLRYRIAIVDPPRADTSISGVRAFRSQFDTKYAALYYPWVEIVDPTKRPDPGAPPATLALPPSGFAAGIFARSDIERGVHKAPANEVVRGITRFMTNVTYDRQSVLNPEGINALRFFEGRSNRVWGARTMSSDPEWKYVNVRRLFIYLEHSIDRSTQWAVFEPNNERLWASIRQTIEDFLLATWTTGAFMGTKPEEAFFVRCDRTTMTQNDLDNGRLICLIGVAPTYPAEFVIFRIGQFTADAVQS